MIANYALFDVPKCYRPLGCDISAVYLFWQKKKCTSLCTCGMLYSIRLHLRVVLLCMPSVRQAGGTR